MGNSSSNPVKNMDKRTSRREYSHAFMAAVADYRGKVRLEDTTERHVEEGQVKVKP